MSRRFPFRRAFASTYDKLYAPRNKVYLERLVVDFGIAGFLLHLALIFLSRSLAHPPALVGALGRNYLSAIETPFTLILFYEVLILIAAIPESTQLSVSKQFEIVSLIFIRSFFSNIAGIDDFGMLQQPSKAMIPIAADCFGALLMFLLVTVFQHLSVRGAAERAVLQEKPVYQTFITRKKVIALSLTVWFLALTLQAVFDFGLRVFDIFKHRQPPGIETQALFYSNVFSVMIFTDVLILVLSLAVSGRYETVFRNAAFVISTILIRFSLTAERPYGAPLALLGMTFGILAILIYRYNSGLRTQSTDQPLLFAG